MPPSRRTVHVPVMLHEVLEQLDLQGDLAILDGTVGAGGHSAQIAQKMSPHSVLVGLDRDETMLARAAQVVTGPHVHLIQSSYAHVESILKTLNIESLDRALVDLGLSSDQLADQSRGFSFQSSAPLDMRFDTSEGLPATELLQQATVEELSHIFSTYGEERHANRIADFIVKRRSQLSTWTGQDLNDVVLQATGGPRDPHTQPAARVFQALRIAVNKELEHLQHFLTDSLPRCLRSGGRAVVISFHSLEDALVKQAFREVTTWDNLTRKPITATPAEIRLNPRSRSAKLRVAVRK